MQASKAFLQLVVKGMVWTAEGSCHEALYKIILEPTNPDPWRDLTSRSILIRFPDFIV